MSLLAQHTCLLSSDKEHLLEFLASETELVLRECRVNLSPGVPVLVSISLRHFTALSLETGVPKHKKPSLTFLRLGKRTSSASPHLASR